MRISKVCAAAAVLAVLALVVLVGGCGGGSSDPAAKAVKQQIEDLDAGRYSVLYRQLHPKQQAFIPEALFVKCAAESYDALDVSDVKVTKTVSKRANIPGTHDFAPGKVLTVSYSVTQGSQTQSTEDTFTEFFVNGKYRLGTSGAEAYKDGTCPSGSSSDSGVPPQG